MDPKSCRQTPHWIIAMICSLPLILISVYIPSFVFWKCVFELNVSLFRWWLRQQLVWSEVAAPRVYSAGALFCEKSKPGNASEESAMSFWTTTWNIVPSFMWHLFFLCESPGIHICTEYSLLCSVWRAAVCMKVEMTVLLRRCWTRGWGSWLGRRLF